MGSTYVQESGPVGGHVRRVLLLLDLMPRLLSLDPSPRSGAFVLDSCRRLADAVRGDGGQVVLVHSLRLDDPQPPGSGLVPGLVRPGDVVLTKRSIDVFATTDLDRRLWRWRAVDVVVAGVMTNLGVESAARTSSDLGFSTTVVADAVSALSDDAHHNALALDLPHFAQVVGVHELVHGDDTRMTQRSRG